MTKTDAKALICEILSSIAPEADLATLAGEEDLRDAARKLEPERIDTFEIQLPTVAKDRLAS